MTLCVQDKYYVILVEFSIFVKNNPIKKDLKMFYLKEQTFKKKTPSMIRTPSILRRIVYTSFHTKLRLKIINKVNRFCENQEFSPIMGLDSTYINQ